jgi:ubiquinone/menaquinone biosynthesis C-methylase UbiE
MRITEVYNYLGEIERVLKPSGRAVVTFFAMEPDLDVQPIPMHTERPFLPLPDDDRVWVLDQTCPEKGIGFSNTLIEQVIDQVGLHVVERVPGYWRGTPKLDKAPYKYSYQDTYVLSRHPLI